MVKKKIFAGILLATLFIGTSSVSANSSGNGWTSGYVKINGENKNCTVSIGGANQKAVRTICTTVARSRRVHDTVTYRYRTVHDGIRTKTGGKKGEVYSTGTTYSGTVYPEEKNNYVDYVSIQGNVKVRTVDQNGASRTYSFSPRLAK